MPKAIVDVAGGISKGIDDSCFIVFAIVGVLGRVGDPITTCLLHLGEAVAMMRAVQGKEDLAQSMSLSYICQEWIEAQQLQDSEVDTNE